MLTDTHCFYTLTEHEVRDTKWVHLYLDLAHCTCNRGMTELSDFDIVQVTIQNLNDAEPPRINSTNVVVYIVYIDLVKARRGEPCERRAIIRRLFNESTRTSKVQGKHWSPFEKEKKRYARLKQRLGVHGAWRLRLRGGLLLAKRRVGELRQEGRVMLKKGGACPLISD